MFNMKSILTRARVSPVCLLRNDSAFYVILFLLQNGTQPFKAFLKANRDIIGLKMVLLSFTAKSISKDKYIVKTYIIKTLNHYFWFRLYFVKKVI